MSKYRKKPVIIEAEKVDELLIKFREDWSNLPRWVEEAYNNHIITTITTESFDIKTLEGTMTATKNDYLIKGINGELYPCKKDIFEKTYEKVED